MGVEGDVLYPFVSFSREEWGRLPADGSFSLSDEEVRSIEPTRDRARLILEKGEDHSVMRVRLRKI